MPKRLDVNTPDRFMKCIIGIVGYSVRHPWLVLVSCLVLVAASIQQASVRLEYHTQRNDLISPDRPCQQRWQKYIDAFGDDDDMIVVAEGADPRMMTAALDTVANRLKEHPEHFDRIFHRIDLRPIHDRAILFLSPEEIRAIDDRLSRMGPLIDPKYGHLRSLAWQHLSLESLLSTAVSAVNSPHPRADERDLLLQLPAVLESAATTLRDPSGYRNPWAIAGAATADRNQESRLTEPQYFFTPDRSLALLTCRPKKSASFTPAKEANAAMRAILAEVQPQFPGVALGLTGLPVLETDEMEMTDFDSRRATWLALIGVAILYLFVYRGLRYPMLSLATLLVGTTWALGWATITIGHLNIITTAFAVMLIGMGDYGVLYTARYELERRFEHDLDDAMRATALHAGPGIVTASITTALAFGATLLSNFQAVVELGWIAGCGILLCAISCLTFMPAALTICERWAESNRVAGNHETSNEANTRLLPFPGSPDFLPRMANRPRLIIVLSGIAVIVSSVFASQLRYDHNLLNLQSPTLESVIWEHRLIERNAGSTWDALSVARNRDEALAFKAQYESLPEVGRVVEIASLIPDNQDEKLPLVRSIYGRLTSIPSPDTLPRPKGSHPDSVRALASQLQARTVSDTSLSHATEQLLRALNGSEEVDVRLQLFDRRLAADLATDLCRLRAVSRPAAIQLDDLPSEFRERYYGNNGEFLVRAFARESLWDYSALQRFTRATSEIDPEATGKSYRTIEGLTQMRTGFERAGCYALVAIIMVLFLDLRRFRDVLLGLLPLIIGAILTAGVLASVNVQLNPANMIAVPLIVGVCVDNGIHVLHDYRERNPDRPFALSRATGKGVLIAGLTTVLGFGMLMIGRHRGMESLGLALSLGVLFSMCAALLILPAVLRLMDSPRNRTSTLLSFRRANAA